MGVAVAATSSRGENPRTTMNKTCADRTDAAMLAVPVRTPGTILAPMIPISAVLMSLLIID